AGLVVAPESPRPAAWGLPEQARARRPLASRLDEEDDHTGVELVARGVVEQFLQGGLVRALVPPRRPGPLPPPVQALLRGRGVVKGPQPPDRPAPVRPRVR